MSDASFKHMTFLFKILDFVFPYLKRRVKKFGISEGMTVVDYGCGPGRYSVQFAQLVGEKGKVYAVDIHELAIQTVEKKMKELNLKNIEPVLVSGYDSTLPDQCADVVCAIDMFFIIKKPTDFLAELHRITKKKGSLVIDDGHQSRKITKKHLRDSGHWAIREESRDHLKCEPL